jgi:hypothetical protein
MPTEETTGNAGRHVQHRSPRRWLRVLHLVCFVLDVLALCLVAILTWGARPRFGIMFAEQNRPPLPRITDAVIHTPGWVYLIPFTVVVVGFVAKEFVVRRPDMKLMLNAIVLCLAIMYVVCMVGILFLPCGLMKGPG